MSTLDALLHAIVVDAQNEDRYAVLADYLEEHDDDPRRAELLRFHRRLLATCCEPERHAPRAAWQARVVTLLAEGVRPCVPQRRVVLGEGVDMTFNFIPPGTFLMGSPEGEEGRRADEALHRVTLTRGFWMGVFPVTQGQWRAVMGSNPFWLKGEGLPVENVSWDACQDFVRELGRTARERFRLPTEAEWEHACRSGTSTAFFFGDAASTDRANYDGNYISGPGGAKGAFREKSTPVGSFPPNAWGLCDMHGNVYEWCQDWAAVYPTAEVSDPRGGESGHARVVRGGSWFAEPRLCRSACRIFYVAQARGSGFGCRVVLCPDD
jgi:uncharacterized protein (TIGR02996 family)